jgi:prepilin peptidase CpaA
MIHTLSIIIPTLILLIATVEDLRSRKIKNLIVVAMILFAFTVALVFDGWHSIPWSLLSLTTAFLLGFPLFVMGVLGAGDVKVFMAFAVLMSWDAVLFVGVTSLFWGAAIGIARSLISGHGKTLMTNTWGLLRYQRKPIQSELTFIPYTVALFFGWGSYLVQSNFWGMT